MLRKTTVALFALASIGMLVPDVASARNAMGGGGFRSGPPQARVDALRLDAAAGASLRLIFCG